MDFDELIQFLRVDSSTGKEEKAARWLSEFLNKQGWDSELVEVTENRFNVYSNLNAKVLLCSHIDTVPPYIPPTQDETTIRGRGSADAKGVIFTQILAAKRVVESGVDHKDIGFLYVIGEEVDHIGAQAVEKLDIHPEVVIVGEPTENKMCIGGMGLLKVKLKSEGVAGHSAYPELSRSAIHEMIRLLDGIETTCLKDTTLGNTLVNVGVIEGGVAANVTAQTCEAILLWRLSRKSSEVLQELSKLIESEAPHTSYTILSRFDPISLYTLDGFPSTVARFNSDAKYFKSKTDKVMLFGPGDIKIAHSDEEFIKKESIIKGIDMHVAVLRQLLH